MIMTDRILLRMFLSLAFAFLAGGFLQAANYVIVVDTSGSMTHSISAVDKRVRITTVQNALRDWLESLPLGSRLTLISFNSGIQLQREFLFQNELNRQQALFWCGGINEESEAHKTGKTHLWTAKAYKVTSSFSEI